jgi:hypothetical protein
VLANDDDADGWLNAATVTVTAGPTRGTYSVDTTTGELTYRSDGSFTGVDTIRYRVRDNQGALSNEATVSINVDNSTQTRRRKWVEKLYSDLLGRSSVTAETDYWVNVIDAGVSMDTIASSFLTSRERRSGFIGEYYQDYLGRQVDAAGLDFWLGVWDATNGPEVVRAGLIGSGEYAAAQGGTAEGVIRGLYNDILGRPASNADVDYWTGVIAHTPLANVALGFLTSDEYRLGMINDWYLDFLHRSTDTSGAQFWLSKMKAGVPQHTIQAALLGSAEYQSNA